MVHFSNKKGELFIVRWETNNGQKPKPVFLRGKVL